MLARSLIKAAVLLGPISLAANPPAPALAVSGPYQVVYVFPGVRDTGGTSATGVATAVTCFSFSPIVESIQFIVRNSAGSVVVNTTYPINPFQTITVATHDTVLYNEDLFLASGIIEQGVLGLSVTSTNIVCTA
jgi:hypothetical protein